MSNYPDRKEAWNLLCEHTKSEKLHRHALAVEAAMRFYARKFGEDESKWSVVGLLHDFDYEENPTEETHCHAAKEILEAKGYPQEMIRAIISHADYMGVPRESLMEKSLYAVDELTGFIIAAALIRPSKSLNDLPVKSVKKRFKDKAFARAVDREAIKRGSEELGLPIEEHIQNVIDALKVISEDLGLS